MFKNYQLVKAKLTALYKSNYLQDKTSSSLAYDIKDLEIDDIIGLLEAVRDTPELSELSISLSRRSELFDKLVLMIGDEPHKWDLRLHTFAMVAQSDKPGYSIDNFGQETKDDESEIHEHRWQLASKFLAGGFRNHEYDKGTEGVLFHRFNLAASVEDGLSKDKSTKTAGREEGKEWLKESSDDLYQQGDLVHYPIVNPHKVDTKLAPYLGITMTLAHTSEPYHNPNNGF